MPRDHSGLYLLVIHRGDGRPPSYYIGSTVNLAKRFSGHRQALVRGDHPNARLQLTWNSYGATALECRVICRLPREDLRFAEQCLIDVHVDRPACLNLARNVFGPPEMTAAVRAKISLANKGRRLSDVARGRISAGMRGHVVRPATRAKIGHSTRVLSRQRWQDPSYRLQQTTATTVTGVPKRGRLAEATIEAIRTERATKGESYAILSKRHGVSIDTVRRLLPLDQRGDHRAPEQRAADRAAAYRRDPRPARQAK